VRRWIVAAVVALVLWPSPGPSQPLGPRVVGWETTLKLDWSVAEDRGRRVVHDYIANQGGFSAAKIRLLVDALDDGRVVGQRVSWLSEIVTPGTRAYFTVPVPAQAPSYRVTVFDYDLRRGG